MRCLKPLWSVSNPLKTLGCFVRTMQYDCLSQKAKLPNSSLLLTNEKRKSRFSTILSDYGFSNGQVTHILNSPVSILELNEKDLLANLTHWHVFEMKNKLFTVLTGNPELLTLQPIYIKHHIKKLMTLFTRKDIGKLFLTCPRVFIDDFEVVQEKVQYIVHNMGVEQNSIVKACALQFTLKHMKHRHNFMSRAGFYIVKKKTKSKNPPLDKIFSRNLDTFLKLTKLTKEEFIVFCDAYDEEEYWESIDSDSDDES